MILTYLLIYVGAFLGGLSINIMPCILPCLPTKLYCLQQQAKKRSPKAVRKFCIFSMLGSTLTMFCLGLIITIAEYFNCFLMWGFYFSSPIVVSFLILSTILLILDVFNIYSIPWHLLFKFIPTTKSTSSYINGLIDGISTVVLSTPCAGPILGSIIGGSFLLPIAPRLVVFSLIGIGLSFPLVLLYLFPEGLKHITRFKKYLFIINKLVGGFLAVLLGWLVYILIGLI